MHKAFGCVKGLYHVVYLTAVEVYSRELKHARFLDTDGNRKLAVFPFSVSSHNHIYIAKYIFSIKND